ncbi:hypothetical protein BDZ45DRAFT_748847 [Acephala macrosclerotiorum]|nr:hypothetical protein BDZ45DRAFT_748847 [Acephala macrosclerotiorum]
MFPSASSPRFYYTIRESTPRYPLHELAGLENTRHVVFHFGSVQTVSDTSMKVAAVRKARDELSRQLLALKILQTLVLMLGWEQDKINRHFKTLTRLDSRPDAELKVCERSDLTIPNDEKMKRARIERTRTGWTEKTRNPHSGKRICYPMAIEFGQLTEQ